MTPKEKAKELVEKFTPMFSYWDYYNDCSRDTNLIIRDAKQCVLIAVDELIKATTPLTSTYYWKEVKQEIEKL